MDENARHEGIEAPRRRVPSWVLAVAGGLCVWALVACVDGPLAVWMLAHREGEIWATLRRMLWPIGSGAIQAGVILALMAGAAALKRRGALRVGGWLLAALVIATLLATSIKWVVRRPRPEHVDEPRPVLALQIKSGEWHSFPSGDVLASTALAVVLRGLLGRPRGWRWLLALPVLVAVQRFAGARHYLSDIVAGAMLGVWVGCMVLWWAALRTGSGAASATLGRPACLTHSPDPDR